MDCSNLTVSGMVFHQYPGTPEFNCSYQTTPRYIHSMGFYLGGQMSDLLDRALERVYTYVGLGSNVCNLSSEYVSNNITKITGFLESWKDGATYFNHFSNREECVEYTCKTVLRLDPMKLPSDLIGNYYNSIVEYLLKFGPDDHRVAECIEHIVDDTYPSITCPDSDLPVGSILLGGIIVAAAVAGVGYAVHRLQERRNNQSVVLENEEGMPEAI